MDVFEINKMVGAILATVLFVVVISEVGDLLVSPTALEKPAYAVTTEEEPAAEQEAAAEPAEPAAEEGSAIAALLAAADAEAGRKTFKKCAACHGVDKGGRNKVGPNLWGVVGRESAAAAGYKYSSALAALGGTWGYEELDQFLANPKGYLSGTKMTYRGLKQAGDRANVILFLRSLSDSPSPLPE
jgi:cytochrome c